MRYLGITITLYLFWFALSGHTAPLLLLAGLLTVVATVVLGYRMDRVDRVPVFVPLRPGFWAYGLWLLGCVVRANIDVVQRIWHPRCPIDPVWRRLDTTLRSPLSQTLYANSITLTPGTFTTEVAEDHLWVHCLSASAYAELAGGAMEQRIQRLGL